MILVIALAILMVLIALTGYYLGPGLGYYGASSICFLLFSVILYQVFAGGSKRKGIVVRPEVEGPLWPPKEGPQ